MRLLNAGLGRTLAGAAAALLLLSAGATEAVAQSEGLFSRNTRAQQGRDKGQYIPTISITPDGCEVWVMDDGAEGYAENHLTRQGIPVCHDMDVCGVINSDQLFATDSAWLSGGSKTQLREFFTTSSAFAYIIIGHTDSRASDAYNLRLSYNRANAVASVAAGAGARIADVRGMGERFPLASNNSAAGMAKNRRVEIICVQ